MNDKWVVVNGSPRKGKNSDYIIDSLEQLSVFKGRSFIRYKLSDLSVAPCTGCEFCLKRGYCHIEDDFQAIVESIRVHKNIILISPSYNYNVTAQMKCFLDRLFSQYEFYTGGYASRLGEGIRSMIIGVSAGDEEGMGYTVEAMKKCMDDLMIEVLMPYKYMGTKRKPAYDNPQLVAELNQHFQVAIENSKY